MHKAYDLQPLIRAGDAAWRNGDTSGARSAYEAALSLAPTETRLSQALGTVCQLRGEYEEAATWFALAHHLGNRDPGLLNNWGESMRARGLALEAASLFREGLAQAPGMAQLHNNLGLALMALGRTGEAEACFREAVRLRPGYAKAHRNLGRALQDSGRDAESGPHFALALAATRWPENQAAADSPETTATTA